MSEEPFSPPSTAAFLSTGNPQLDAILSGGFPLNSLNIIMGEPGTGKTIFAEQMAFHHAREDDRPVLYITTLSEPLSKVLTYLQRLDFYDESLVGNKIIYQDISFALAEHGVGALKDYLNEAIYSISPKLIFIDSFKALHDLVESPKEMRHMLHELTGMLSVYATTVFFVGEYTEEQSRLLPEFAIADGILQFMRNPLSSRDERFLRVFKLRGSEYQEGLHGFKITQHGLEIFPRLVSPHTPKGYELSGKRLTTGVDGLDKLLAGGLLEGSTTLVSGASGSGKTTACLQFVLEGIKQGQPSLYVNFQENPTQLARSIKNLGGDIKALCEKGLYLFYSSPVELQIDSIIERIFRLISEHQVKRVVIDALGDLMTASNDPHRIHNYLYALNQLLSLNGVTSLWTFETARNDLMGVSPLPGRFSAMSDGIIVIRSEVEHEVRRSLFILKQRSSAHDLGIYNISIGSQGMKIESPLK